MFAAVFTAVLPLLLGVGSAATHHQHGPRSASSSSSSEPRVPSEDPWYTAPTDFAAAAPGAVLRVRAAPGNVSSLANASAVYNILYRTTDTRYRPAWAVTTLFVPRAPVVAAAAAADDDDEAGAGGATALLSYQIPYDSASVDASPSYTPLLWTNGKAVADITESLDQGWYVSVPDYEGPLASFSAGVQSGHATIDAVRAVLASGFGLADASAVRYAMWGYSGGALASEWAAELQVQYAPELRFAGAALGGPPPNPLAVFESCSGRPCAGLLPGAFLGMVRQHPDAQAYLLSQLKPAGPRNATTFLSVREGARSVGEVAAAFVGHDIADYFVDGEAVLEHPLIRRIVNTDGRMGYHGVPAAPLYVYHAIEDEVTPVGLTDALVARFCDVGVDIAYDRLARANHSEGSDKGRAAALAFLRRVLSGTYTPPAAGCVIADRAYNGSAAARKRSADAAPLWPME